MPRAVAILVVVSGHGLLGLRWLNHAFVWLAVHQLGFLWRAGRADDRAVAAGWALGGLAFLVFLVEAADYPVSLLSRFEHDGKRRAGPPPATSVQVAGGMLMCLGLAFLALQGVGARSFPWIHVVPLVLALGGAAIVLLYRGRDSVK